MDDSLKKELIKILKRKKCTLDELQSRFNVDIKNTLTQLEYYGDVVFYKDKYFASGMSDVYKAKITSMKDYFAFASYNERDFYISSHELSGALLDDEVIIAKNNKPYERESYKVLKIIKRARESVVGELKIVKGVFYLDVKDIAPIDYDFIISKSKISLIMHSIVEAKITKFGEDYCIVEPITVHGLKSDPGVEITRIILSHGAPVNFNEDVLKEVEQIPNYVSKDDIEYRTDFRKRTIVTIDGDDAKDFDDAVEVRKVGKKYYIGVHIADVSHYVKEGSNIDKEAYLRSTSIYASDRVVPMLPFELSNGICSLNPNVDRLVQSVEFTMDEKGNILNKKLHKGVIKSSARLTYKYVNRVLKEGLIDESIPKKVNDMIPLLKEVSDIIRKKRTSKGCIDLASVELNFELNDDNSVRSVTKRVQDDAEKLIEDLMIEANSIVTQIIEEKGLPFLYRIHENPRVRRLNEFMELSALLGYKCDFDPLTVKPMELQNHLNKIDKQNLKEILSSYLLRAMAKARYSFVNRGHFGLALKDYTHFTSPIRRYPDLIVHRLIDLYIFHIGKEKSLADIENELFEIGENTSVREKRSQTIEREVDDLLSAKYMSKFIGEEFEAKIVSFSPYGIYLELENGIDGFLSFESMSKFNVKVSDYTISFNYGKKYKLGDKLKVVIEECNLDKYQVLFSLPKSLKDNKINNRGKKNERRKKKGSK